MWKKEYFWAFKDTLICNLINKKINIHFLNYLHLYIYAHFKINMCAYDVLGIADEQIHMTNKLSFHYFCEHMQSNRTSKIVKALNFYFQDSNSERSV